MPRRLIWISKMLWILIIILAFSAIAIIKIIPVPHGNQPNNLIPIKLSRGTILKQFFTDTRNDLVGVSLVFLVPGKVDSGKLGLTLSAVKDWNARSSYLPRERKLFTIKVPISQLQPDRETTFRFPKQQIKPGETLVLSLSTSLPHNKTIACLVSKQSSFKKSSLFINNKMEDYSLFFQVHHPESLVEIFKRLIQRQTRFLPLLPAKVIPVLFLFLIIFTGWWIRKCADFWWAPDQDEFNYYTEV